MPAKKAQGASPIATQTRGSVGTVVVHKTLYPADVLFGTAFGFLDRAYLHLDVQDADRIKVEIEARPGTRFALDELVGEFKNELVNQALRHKLAKQTEKVRTMIVGRAIAEAIPLEGTTAAPAQPAAPALPDLPPEVAKLLAEEEDSLDFLDDPLGIAVPWEEKYGKKDGEPAKKDGEPAKGGKAK